MSLEVNKKIDENIDPDDIIFDDDSDMPEPETKLYEQLLMVTEKFITLFNNAIGSMPYTTVLKNNLGNQLKLIDLAKFVDAKISTGFTVLELNTILTFLANAEFKYVRELMSTVEDKSKQNELWTVKQ